MSILIVHNMKPLTLCQWPPDLAVPSTGYPLLIPRPLACFLGLDGYQYIDGKRLKVVDIKLPKRGTLYNAQLDD